MIHNILIMIQKNLYILIINKNLNPNHNPKIILKYQFIQLILIINQL